MYASKGLPAWRQPRIMPLLGFSGLTEGMGVYLLIAAYIGDLPAMLPVLCATLVIARAAAWYAYLAETKRSTAPESTIEALKALTPEFVIVGHALPLIFVALGYLIPGQAILFATLAGITATLGGWYMKINIVTRAAYIPKFEIPRAPVRGQ